MKGRNARIKHMEFRTPKEVRGSKDGTNNRVCVRERAKERERKSARELRGEGRVSGWVIKEKKRKKTCNIFGIHFLLSTGTLGWQLNVFYSCSYFLTDRNVE